MALDLEVAIELLGKGVRSSNAAARTFAQTAYQFDAADYDGATFYFEVVAQNSHASIAYSPVLYDQTNGSDAATASVPANTSPVKRCRGSAFTPPSGMTEYRVKVPQTASLYQLYVFTARIVIVQVDATKTELVFPLCYASYISSVDNQTFDDGVCSKSSTSWGVVYSPFFYRDDLLLSSFASGNPWTVSGTAMNSSGTGTCEVTLWNATHNAQVTDCLLSTSSSTYVFVSDTLAGTETNFTTAHDYVPYYRAQTTGTAAIGRLEIRVKLTDLSKAEVCKRIGGQHNASTALEIPHQRALHTDANWQSGYTVYFEVTGYCMDVGGTPVSTSQTNGDSGAGTPLAPYIDWDNAGNPERHRTDAVTLTDGYTQIAEKQATTNSQNLSAAFLIYVLDDGSSVAGAYMTLRPGMW